MIDRVQVHEFLVAFPPHDSIVELILSKETTLEALFPPTAPFKILYSVYTLRTCLLQQTQNVRKHSGWPLVWIIFSDTI